MCLCWLHTGKSGIGHNFNLLQLQRFTGKMMLKMLEGSTLAVTAYLLRLYGTLPPMLRGKSATADLRRRRQWQIDKLEKIFPFQHLQHFQLIPHITKNVIALSFAFTLNSELCTRNFFCTLYAALSWSFTGNWKLVTGDSIISLFNSHLTVSQSSHRYNHALWQWLF